MMRSAATRAALARIALAALGLTLFALHASLYGDWLIDDSGISLAYAIHFAQGHGLVSQPGLLPVEGYSNPLWVLLLAALSRAGMLALPIGPKLASGLLIAGAYAVLLAILDRIAPHPRLVGAAVLLACSINPALVIWCTSGLENALYASTVVALLYCTVRVLEAAPSGRASAVCGMVAALVAMTRPDGVLFALVPPAVALAAGRREKASLVAYATTFVIPFGGLLGSRMLTFHHLVPNTAVAKGGPRLNDAIDFLLLTRTGIDKMDRLLEAAFPAPLANAVFIGSILTTAFIAKKGRIQPVLAILLAYATMALVDYMVMPADWMREVRFGTPFFPLYYAAIFVLVDIGLDIAMARRRAIAFAVVTASLLCAGLPAFAGRALAFARTPNIGLSFVRSAFADRFDRYAAALHVANPSVLLPDVGGMLLWSHARVYDLAGLCDASIARSLARDHEAEREYVLGQARPTFIHIYGKYAQVALEDDPRFESDYLPIHSYDKIEDPEIEGHASGIFVRRDVVTTPEAEAELESFRRETHERRALVPKRRPSSLFRWLERTPVVPPYYRVARSGDALDAVDVTDHSARGRAQ